MNSIKIQASSQVIQGEIVLSGSKSISNRALIIRALCKTSFPIKNLSTAKDTVTLQQLLSSKEEILDAGHAGTTFRFMTAFLALQKGTQTLTGSERMKQRPIGVLVRVLNKLGANIEYLEQEDYPPLRIHSPNNIGKITEVQVAADISSQYISALLLIAPTLPRGLTIHFQGEPVSMPYIRMTLRMMAYFGIDYQETGDSIQVKHGAYQAKNFQVESDWSSASYYYAFAALAKQADITINGLFKESLQGDSIISEIGKHFGVRTHFQKNSIQLTRFEKNISSFQYNFTDCPDLAQTIAVICAGLGIQGTFSGLKTLRIKETDRIAALQTELEKINISTSSTSETLTLGGKPHFQQPIFATYQDHRMAMAFAPLALLYPIEIQNPNVVIKSYPNFWEDIEGLDIQVK